VNIQYVFAGLPVGGRDRAVAWYQRLFGRPPDMFPNDNEAVWQLAATASLYVIVDEARAGGGTATVVVDDLARTVHDVATRGIDAGPIEEIPDVGRKAMITDPDGNAVSIVEIFA
jgi:predicted enzyme related to lactoylglutathione lyase